MDMIKRQYGQLIEAFATAKETREYILTQLRDPRMASLLKRYEEQTEVLKETLTAAEKKDIDRLQAQILARREMLTVFRNSYAEELERASRSVKDFEESNQIFMQAIKENEPPVEESKKKKEKA